MVNNNYVGIPDLNKDTKKLIAVTKDNNRLNLIFDNDDSIYFNINYSPNIKGSINKKTKKLEVIYTETEHNEIAVYGNCNIFNFFEKHGPDCNDKLNSIRDLICNKDIKFLDIKFSECEEELKENSVPNNDLKNRDSSRPFTTEEIRKAFF